MKRLLFSSIIVIAAVSAIVSCNSNNRRTNKAAAELDDSTKLAIKMEKLRMEEPEFEIITSHGTMKVKLYSQTPKHRDNFAKLVSENYYDSIRFHRVINGFMIQTGDPFSRDTALINKWGTGGPDPDYTVPAEFASDYHHKKGALAAARKGDLANPRKASSGSQFYIVHDPENCAHLDGQYSIFGEVISGLDIIDKIATLATDNYDRPYEDVIINTIKPVIELAPVKETPAQTDSTKTE
jgi:cyclophilin family peptidyl-prolyl cis-trans isomerase